MEKPEILAPAGSMAALKAAISAGADAVYMGGSSFGARAFADNPDTEEMLAAIRYVHLRGKRLYLTVNTLVKEQEFGALYEFLAPYYSAGLDAAIVQDVGVLRFLTREFPGLSLHASTQMTLTAPEGIRLFDGYPVTRLVPARELSLSEITEICKNSGKEVEIFVHGALCYCYSGQCLMSSMIGGRSGNRGRCAQPCRMEYESEEYGKKYWLSPKDLCGLSLLPELIETGAASFKIEGRMKRPEYAAAVSAAYRRFTDLYASLGGKEYRRYLSEHPQLLSEEVERLSDIYNRGSFTDGCFLRHNSEKLMSVERPGHFGVLVGEVVTGGKGEASIRFTKPVHAQDVLELRREREEAPGVAGYYEYTIGVEGGAKAGEVRKARLLPKLVSKPGDRVYRMRNAALLNELEEQYGKKELRVPVSGVFYAKVGEVCTLTVSAEGASRLRPVPFPKEEKEIVSVCTKGFVCEKAGKLPASVEAVKKQLEKTGNEPFYFESLEIVLADDVFLPNGLLNELRRTALAQLAEAMEKRFERTEKPENTAVDENAEYAEECSTERDGCDVHGTETPDDRTMGHPYVDCVVSTKAQAEAAANIAEVRRIYLDMIGQSIPEVCTFANEFKASGKEIWYCFPRICRKDTLARIKAEFSQVKESFDGYLIRNYETLALVKELDEEWHSGCMLDYNMYVMNREAEAFYQELSEGELPEMTAPVELSARELRALGVENKTLVVYGRLPLMVTAHCVKKTMGCCTVGRKNQKMLEQQGMENGYTEETSVWEKAVVLTDRVGKKLPVVQNCAECYNLIYNPECLSLLDGSIAAEHLSPAAVRLDFTFESAEEVTRILRSAGSGSAVTGTGYTRGHFKRGVE